MDATARSLYAVMVIPASLPIGKMRFRLKMALTSSAEWILWKCGSSLWFKKYTSMPFLSYFVQIGAIDSRAAVTSCQELPVMLLESSMRKTVSKVERKAKGSSFCGGPVSDTDEAVGSEPNVGLEAGCWGATAEYWGRGSSGVFENEPLPWGTMTEI